MGTEITGRNPDSMAHKATKITLRDRGRVAWRDTRVGLVREVIYVASGGGLGVFFMTVFGPPGSTRPEIFVGLSAVASAVVVPIGEYIWRFIRAPRLILQERLETQAHDHAREIVARNQDREVIADQYRAIAETRPRVYAHLDRHSQDWIVRVENSGPTGTFSANMTVRNPPPGCREAPGNKYQLFWEHAESTKAEITTGGGDWVKIAYTKWHAGGDASMSLYRYEKSTGRAWRFCNQGYIPDQTPETVISIQVVITANPEAFNGPLVFEYDVDHHGVRATADG